MQEILSILKDLLTELIFRILIIDRQINSWSYRQIERQIDRQIEREIGRYIDRQKDRYNRKIDRQIKQSDLNTTDLCCKHMQDILSILKDLLFRILIVDIQISEQIDRQKERYKDRQIKRQIDRELV